MSRMSRASLRSSVALTPLDASETLEASGNQESDSLLDKIVSSVIKNPRHLSIFYGVCNMSNFLIGAGILGLTSVFSTGGWLIGLILFLIFGLATWFSLDLLLDAASSTHVFSYEGLGLAVGGWTLQMVHTSSNNILPTIPKPNIASQFVKIIIIIDSYGFLAAYMNVAGAQ
jgi:hypothetical protein